MKRVSPRWGLIFLFCYLFPGLRAQRRCGLGYNRLRLRAIPDGIANQNHNVSYKQKPQRNNFLLR